MDEETFAFGAFRLIPAQRVLLDDGKPLRLGSRALDILITLVEHAGETMSKEQLIARTWPDTVVDEGALRVHVAALRKALSDGRAGRRYITNIPGRGYAFVAPVKHEHTPAALAPTNGAAGNDLPVPLTRIIGRDDVIAALAKQLARRRLLTIVGPGGIGKTTVAVAVADALRGSYKDGTWFVGLASLSDPDLVPGAVSAALGIHSSGVNPLPGLAAWLRDKAALIVLDSCEHVIEAAAPLAEAVLKAAPGVSILTTSREPLRAEGEALHRLAALELPSDPGKLAAIDALRYSAVQLFNERATAAADGFALTDADVPAVLEICRRLDGIPLALELAAARVDLFGVCGLAAHLDDRFRLLTTGRRTALPRHQTLGAALDWSYQLLPEEERAVLRRLSVFAGDFPLEAAVAVAADPGPSEIVDHVANLFRKSLVVADPRGEVPQYRLLDTTRLYAFEKLKSSGELQQVARRHAEYYCTVFAHADAKSESRPQAEWLAIYGRHLDNVRAGLDWAFSPEGDPHIGIALTIASGLLWTRLSLSDECCRLTKRALSALGPGSDLATRRQIQLLALLGWSLQQTSGATPETHAAFSKILELSEGIHDIKSKSLAMWGLWIYHFNNGEFATALDLAQKSIAEEGVDTFHSLAGERIIGLSLHYLGEQSSSRRQIESVLRRPVDPLHQPRDLSFAIDHRVTLRAFLARILWLQGFPDQAMHMAKENVEEALALNHALSLANALVQAACPIAFFTGDLVAAEHFVCMLLGHSTKHALGPWQAWGRCFEAMLLIKRGDIAIGLQRLSTAVSGLRDIGHAVYYLAFIGELAEALGRAGQTARGLATIDDALARSERSKERWCVAELLRIKGELVVLMGASGAKRAAEEHFRQSLDWARRQGALSWELRSATSLARLLRDQGRSADTLALLQPVYYRFTEGFDTPDLKEARSLLDELGGTGT